MRSKTYHNTQAVDASNLVSFFSEVYLIIVVYVLFCVFALYNVYTTTQTKCRFGFFFCFPFALKWKSKCSLYNNDQIKTIFQHTQRDIEKRERKETDRESGLKEQQQQGTLVPFGGARRIEKEREREYNVFFLQSA
jgi:hypothetical protein